MSAGTPSPGGDDRELLESLHEDMRRLTGSLSLVIRGQDSAIREVAVVLLAGGHGLIEGVPGLGKTQLVHSLARLLDLSFSRIQFTPDLMPSDIAGSDILQDDPETGRKRLEFLRGAVFANVILADEINRAPPKTQSAMLEAMQEGHVTAAGRTYVLPRPTLVLATQNPIEQEGTYPLPEAQLDRFMMSILVDYPARDDERSVLELADGGLADSSVAQLSRQRLMEYQSLVTRIVASRQVLDTVLDVVRATRPTDPTSPDFIRRWVRWGAGTRAARHLLQAARARAAMDGSPMVRLSDVEACVVPSLRHRLVLSFSAQAEGIRQEQILTRLCESGTRLGRLLLR